MCKFSGSPCVRLYLLPQAFFGDFLMTSKYFSLSLSFALAMYSHSMEKCSQFTSQSKKKLANLIKCRSVVTLKQIEFWMRKKSKFNFFFFLFFFQTAKFSESLFSEGSTCGKRIKFNWSVLTQQKLARRMEQTARRNKYIWVSEWEKPWTFFFSLSHSLCYISAMYFIFSQFPQNQHTLSIKKCVNMYTHTHSVCMGNVFDKFINS